MKRTALTLLAGASILMASAFPKALYVKKGDSFAKYNFGVAGDLKFSNGGRTLNVTGYEESINLDEIDYITFNAPTDNNALTPAQSKERLVKIGEELYGKFKVDDQAEIVRMTDIFLRKYQSFYLDPKYVDVHTEMPKKLASFAASMAQLAKGKVGEASRVKLNGVELYTVDDYFGIFEANNATQTWDKKSDADHLEVIFPNADASKSYKLVFTRSAEYTDWTEVDFVGRVPKTMTVKGYFGDQELFSVVINSEINNEGKSADLTMKATLLNGYVVDNNLKIGNWSVTDDVNVSIKGESIVKSHAVVHGNQLTNYPAWKEDFNNTTTGDEYWDEQLQEYIEVDDTRSPMLAGHFTMATAEADIIGKLQVKGRLSSIGKLYKVLEEDSSLDTPIVTWDEASNTRTHISDDINVYNKQISHLNNYSDISFYYDNLPTLQGFFSWELSEDEDKYYDERTETWDDEKQEMVPSTPHWERYVYYEQMPLLTFPDMTTFAVEDYFNGTDFSSLVDDYNAIIDTYYTISGNTRPTEE